MTPEYLLILFGLLPSILAVAALAYALARRQSRATDQEMYSALGEEEPDYTAAPAARRIAPLQAGIFVLALLVIFGVIGWTIFETVRVSQQAAASSPQASSEGGK